MVEGVGDHGCEYMTGGVAVILGKTGRNFGAGMSGGVAYVYDPKHTFAEKCNMEMVDLFGLNESGDDQVLKELIEKHLAYTKSTKAAYILHHWDTEQQHFVKVYPTEYHHMLDTTATFKDAGYNETDAVEMAFESVVGTQLTIPSRKE